jgi:murein L,D-transpeptidase YcbB/YkuD
VSAPGPVDGRCERQRAISDALAALMVEADPSADDAFWVYAAQGLSPVWHRGGRPTEAAWRLIEALVRADRHGLDPGAYLPLDWWLEIGRAEQGLLTPERTAALDLRLTRGFLAYAADMVSGPGAVLQGLKGWHLSVRKVDAVSLLAEAISAGDASAALAALTPRHRQYGRLQDALERYRDLEAQGGWEPVPDGPILRKGDSGDAVRAVVGRLLKTGELPPAEARGAAATGLFDRRVEEAVRRFQDRHGLKEDGLVGPDTRRAMNVSASERVEQIELQLARWRLLPDLEDRYLMVNIPEFRLRVFEGDEVTLAMRVIVGKERQPTPVFADSMEYVVFDPYWNVPRSIAVREILPKLREDPGYLASQNMEVLVGNHVVDPDLIDWNSLSWGDFPPYRLRQRPGPDNALGLVKFLLPNHHAVYLHDTPAHYLFERAKRGFSHGCIRLERPADLVEYLLGPRPEGPQSPVEGPLGTRGPRWVVLREPLPVYIVYFTVYVEDDGEVRFLDDLYGYDSRMYARLGAKPSV